MFSSRPTARRLAHWRLWRAARPLPGQHPGGASGSFSYRVVAKRADIRVRRLERVKMPTANKVALPKRKVA